MSDSNQYAVSVLLVLLKPESYQLSSSDKTTLASPKIIVRREIPRALNDTISELSLLIK